MEVAGVEPASEIKIQRTSTYIVYLVFDFKLQNRQRSLKAYLLLNSPFPAQETESAIVPKRRSILARYKRIS